MASFGAGRSYGNELSDRVFVGLLGFYVAAGFGLSAAIAVLTYNMRIPLVVGMVIGLVIPIVGIIISAKSDNWLVSTFGYLLVVVPFGALLGPVVAQYELTSVIQIAIMVFFVSVGMWIVGMVIPPIASNWSGYFVMILLVIILGDVARVVMVSLGIQTQTFHLWHWAIAVFFAGLIVYDVNKAMQGYKTMDNVADAACGIYLDILNLFLRVLAAGGNKKSR